MTKGPIVIVDDDKDDRDTYSEAIKAIGISNELKLFMGAKQALEYLSTTIDQPFIILSDINMPRINGIQFKEAIQNDEMLKNKGIPFVFISTNASYDIVRQAQILSVQGFFEKQASFDDIKSMLQKLFDYWELCKHLNNV
ncbi:MAG TPA: response regulator [Segetibacter sp.]|jgi:CheY-like chemotaxis protein